MPSPARTPGKRTRPARADDLRAARTCGKRALRGQTACGRCGRARGAPCAGGADVRERDPEKGTMAGFTTSIAGDSAISLEFSRAISTQTSRLVRAAAHTLEANPIPGVIELVPALCSLMVCYDPNVIGFDDLVGKVEDKLRGLSAAAADVRRIVRMPVCYGGDFGPDLATVAAHAGLSERTVVELHSGRDYLIDMLGFLPGFAYLDGLDERLSTPRLDAPRTRIEAGSVGIGGTQTGIYPLASPGGWHIIGRTPVRPYDPNRPRPILYDAGDRLRFVPVSPQEYGRIEQLVANGTFDHDSLVEEFAGARADEAEPLRPVSLSAEKPLAGARADETGR